MIAASLQQIKQHQRKLFYGLIGLGVLIGGVLLSLGKEESPITDQSMKEKASLYDVTKALEDKSFWVFQSEQRLSQQERTQQELMKALEEIREALKNPLESNELKTLHDRVRELEQKNLPVSSVETFESHPNDNPSPTPYPPPFYFQEESSQALKTHPVEYPPEPKIFSETLSLAPASFDPASPHHERYIPAGSYAKAVLLSGVDVSVGISSQTHPQPVLLRLVHPGSLPNHFAGKLKDCRIIAAAFGELSSERAQFRLEKLSCVEPDGRVIETDVDGYISGEDGKNGMRGRLVMRDLEVLKRGFLGGLLSGLGKATAQSFTTTSVSPLGAVSRSNGRDVLPQSGAEGAGNAFELMARYNIQRAEQYQPVIQISAGREATVIFHSGKAFGQATFKQPIKPHDPNLDFFGESS